MELLRHCAQSAASSCSIAVSLHTLWRVSCSLAAALQLVRGEPEEYVPERRLVWQLLGAGHLLWVRSVCTRSGACAAQGILQAIVEAHSTTYLTAYVRSILQVYEAYCSTHARPELDLQETTACARTSAQSATSTCINNMKGWCYCRLVSIPRGSSVCDNCAYLLPTNLLAVSPSGHCISAATGRSVLAGGCVTRAFNTFQNASEAAYRFVHSPKCPFSDLTAGRLVSTNFVTLATIACYNSAVNLENTFW